MSVGRSRKEQAASPAQDSALDWRDDDALESLLHKTLKQVNRPLRMDEILRITKLPRKAKKAVDALLRAMEQQGSVLRSSGGWSSPARLSYVQGTLSVQRAGMGFVSPASGGRDVYIHPSALHDAWPGDTVEVLLLPGKRGPSAEGRIIRVLRRALTELPLRALRRQKDEQWLCAPLNQRIPTLFLVNVEALPKGTEKDDLLLATPGERIGPNLWTAVAQSNLEHEEGPAAQERLVKSLYSIPGPFPPAVLEGLKGLPADPEEQDFADRRDLRDLDFVTIDGRFARDFDDAIYAESTARGFRLRVAIADVAHYVRPGSPLDAEACLRGNSHYFPLSVEPMLPEALSNGLCSLKPDVPRLVMTADMNFSPEGHLRSCELYPAVIRSRARLTYGQIQRVLELHDPEEEARLAALLPMLKTAEALARQLMRLRRERGSLEFSLPEAEAFFDDKGMLCRLGPRERHFGHRLIEECMIAANEAVASFLENRGQPFLYRAHPPPDPDKFKNLADFIAQSGLGGAPRHPERARRVKASPPVSATLGRILDEVKNSPHEYIVTRLALRSMMQARYQTEKEGHFGLASACYCHFTSPIRRYADLLVHRTLKRSLGLPLPAGEKPLPLARLEAVAQHLNETERNAMDAERELHKRLSALLLRERIGDAFDGIVSGVAEFGLFVELPACMAEGMIRLAWLGDDYYEYLPERQELRGKRSRRSFRLGQSLRVLVTDVSLNRLEINLRLEEGPQEPGPSRSRSGISLTGRVAPRKETRKVMRKASAKKRSRPVPEGRRRS